MGHPDRRILRERKRRKKQEEMLGRRNTLSVLDLTPHNAVGRMRSPRFTVKFK